MSKKEYSIISSEQIEKIGNAIIYLSDEIGPLSKTKILKLLYILDEISIKKSGIPFFNLTYKVWKFGPVSEEVFIDLSTDLSMFKPFIKEIEGKLYTSVSNFNNDEFSNNDVKLLDFVIEHYGSFTAKELIDFTHRKNAPWYIAAVEHEVLELLTSETINNTEIIVDFSSLISHDESKKMIYESYLEMN